MAYVPVTEGEGAHEIQLTNIEQATYPAVTLSTDPYQKMFEDAHYVNYFLCGYKAILAHHEDLRS